jgi:hypothetical protein
MVFSRDHIMPCSDEVTGFSGNSEYDLAFEWLNCLKQSEADLMDLIRGTEGEFIVIGSRLEEFYNRANDISENSSAVIRLLSGDEIVHSIEILKDLLIRIEQYQGIFRLTAQTQIQQIDQILKVLNGITEPLNDFRNITRILRTLSATTKIQSALIGSPAGGFNILAENVKKLSVLIDLKSDSIHNKLKTLGELIDRIYMQLLAFETEQKNKIEVILTNTMNAVGSLNSKYDTAKSKARDIAEGAGDISRNIRALITSIQIHDITRQKFDGIRKTIRDIYVKSEGQISENDLTVRVENIVKEQSSLLIPLLSATASDFQEAVQSIINNLVTISGDVMNIIKAPQSMVGDIDSDQRTFISELENSISYVSSAILSLSESAVTVRELSVAIQSLAASTEEILQFVHEIKAVGDDLKLISLNSTIKAEEIGSAGASLSVVAEFVKQMSDDSHVKAYKVSNAIESIVVKVEELSRNVKEKSVIEEYDVKDMTANMESIKDQFHLANGNIIVLLNNLREKGQELAFDIENATGDIDIHKTIDRKVGGVISRFEAVLNHMETTSDGKLIFKKEEDMYLRNSIGEQARETAPFRSLARDDTDQRGSEEEDENFILF